MSWHHRIASCTWASCLAAAGLALAPAAGARGAVISAPFTSSDVTDFTIGGTGDGPGTWSSPLENQLTDAGHNSASGAVVDTTGVAGNNFTVSTDFHVVSVTMGGTFIMGLAALSDSTGMSSDWSNSKFYAGTVRFDYDWTKQVYAEHLDISTSTPDNYGHSLISSGQAVVPDSWVGVGSGNYHLSMSGDYDASGDLTLSVTLTDKDNSANTMTVVADPIAAADLSTGTYFGLRDGAYWGGGDVQYSNFALTNTVPEPATLALLGLGGLCVLGRRRRAA